jgi:Fe-S cluster assembly protein SufD
MNNLPFINGYRLLSNPEEVNSLITLKRNALEQYKKTGILNKKSYSWEGSNITHLLSKRNYQVSQEAPKIDLKDLINSTALPDLNAYTIVLVNGKYNPSLMLSDLFPNAIFEDSIFNVFTDDQAFFETKVCNLVADDNPLIRQCTNEIPQTLSNKMFERSLKRNFNNPFVYLNTAYLHDGLLIELTHEKYDKPIHIIHLISGSRGKEQACFPRIAISSSKETKADIIETFHKISSGEVLYNQVSEIQIGKNSKITHQRNYTDLGGDTIITNYLASKINDSADYKMNFTNLKSNTKYIRNEVDLFIMGNNAHAGIFGTYELNSGHFDTVLRSTHMQRNAASEHFCKGILNGTSSSSFLTEVIIAPNASQVETEQIHKALVIPDANGKEPQVISKPMLDIFNDNVKANHGSSISTFNKNRIFYLKQRGIKETQAKELLKQSFLTL